MCDVLVRHNGDHTIARWISATWSAVWLQRPSTVLHEGCGIQVVPTRRCAVTASVVPCCG